MLKFSRNQDIHTKVFTLNVSRFPQANEPRNPVLKLKMDCSFSESFIFQLFSFQYKVINRQLPAAKIYQCRFSSFISFFYTNSLFFPTYIVNDFVFLTFAFICGLCTNILQLEHSTVRSINILPILPHDLLIFTERLRKNGRTKKRKSSLKCR